MNITDYSNKVILPEYIVQEDIKSKKEFILELK